MSDSVDTLDDEGFISCKAAARLMSFRRDGSLGPDEDAHLERHLLACLNCRNFGRQLDLLAMLAKRYAAGGAPVIVVPIVADPDTPRS
jgi:predicted anti-sigma-YlaC factor YlaD